MNAVEPDTAAQVRALRDEVIRRYREAAEAFRAAKEFDLLTQATIRQLQWGRSA